MRNSSVIIDLRALRHNLELMGSLSQSTTICLAVKANAYGHGSAAIAAYARSLGIEALGVASPQEALELRDSQDQGRIIYFGLSSPAEIDVLIRHDIEFLVAHQDDVMHASQLAKKLGAVAKVHLKIDTGMARIGCAPHQALSLAKQIFKEKKSLKLMGTCTHFPVADAEDRSFSDKQVALFCDTVAKIRAAGVDPGQVHASNSAAAINFPNARFDMLRIGIAAYGYHPMGKKGDRLGLKPIMSLKSNISFIKELAPQTGVSYGLRHTTQSWRWIATVACGYADGLVRLASGKICFSNLDGSHHWQQIGTICMDQCMLDLGPSRDDQGRPIACPADRWQELVVFGPSPSAQDAGDLAEIAQTIPYEICCGIPSRLTRTYLS